MYGCMCVHMCYVYPKSFMSSFLFHIYIFLFNPFCFIYFCLTCVYLCTACFVYKLNCFPSLCHTLMNKLYMIVCCTCLNYVLLNVCLHLVTSTSTVHACRGKWGDVKQIYSSVSQCVYITNMGIFMY